MTISCQEGEIERPEVGIEVLVDQLIVNGEVVSVGCGLGSKREQENTA